MHVTTEGSAIEGVCEKMQKRLVGIARESAGDAWKRVRHGDIEFSRGAMRLRRAPAVAWPVASYSPPSGSAASRTCTSLYPISQAEALHPCHALGGILRDPHGRGLGRFCVNRVVSAIAAGRIMTAKTGRSQIIGGVIWGISQTLYEETHADHALGHFMNYDFSGYHVDVNADIHDINVIFPGKDHRIASRLGAKGVGEIDIVDMAAAVSNAIYHTTCHRLRSTPMTPNKVMVPSCRSLAGDATIEINGEAGVPKTQSEL
ncbi:molybdopterin cofactor-binding domain-containing protein [Pseudomonas aeruginosa]|uniref:molybdopterin cofactor-binding domain-containing protein n=1 Tax=Pseudomonas aeruginosa TaxID=287 RepID=UPI003A4D8F97